MYNVLCPYGSIIYPSRPIYIYVWIYENGAKELNSHTKRRFLLAKGHDIKMKRRVSPFSLPAPVFPPFNVVLSLFFALLRGLEVV